jgi:CubicO group peptidase (beta-lactamase class C family)
VIVGPETARGIDRRRLLGWSGLAAVGTTLAAAPLAHADPPPPAPPGDDRIPPDTRPGGAYDRYVAQLAAQGEFSGVVMLAHRGRTVLSRSYGMADREKGIPNGEGTAFTLSSAGKPMRGVAILQLVQQGEVKLSDTIGTHLTGFPPEIADQVTVHHLLTGTTGVAAPDEDVQLTTNSREEVHDYWARWARQSTRVAPVGSPTAHSGPEVPVVAMIVEAVSGLSYWDYVEQNVFRRCGMTGTAFFTRPQWLTDTHLAHPYMALADGSEVDAVRNLDQGSPQPFVLGKNPGRTFIDAPGDGGFATAPDLVRFARALRDATVLDRPYVELFTGAKFPHLTGEEGGAPPANPSFEAYGMPVDIVDGQWIISRGGGGPGVGANWTIYSGTDWVGVILTNSDSTPLQDIAAQEFQAVTGQPAPGGGGGG